MLQSKPVATASRQCRSLRRAAAPRPFTAHAPRTRPIAQPPQAVTKADGRLIEARVEAQTSVRPSKTRGRRIRCQSVPSGASPTVAKGLPALPPLDDTYEAACTYTPDCTYDEEACTFTPFCNWLIPDSVMLGRYPYVEPSRCTSRKQGERQLLMLVDTGFDVFVSLQEETPPQTEFSLAGKNGFLPYQATADLIQAAREGPPPMTIVQGLRNPILDKFLPENKKPKAPEYQPKRLQYVHFPIVDLGVPDMDKLKTLVDELQARIEKGEKLYVHCWGGRGRAGTVGAALLLKAYGLSIDEALERVQRAYSTRNDPERSKSPETDAQFAFLREFAASL